MPKSKHRRKSQTRPRVKTPLSKPRAVEDQSQLSPENEEAYREHVWKVTKRTVETQLRTGQPAETQATLDRLKGEGHTRDEAMRMIGMVLMRELGEIMRDEREFDEPAYCEALRALPEFSAE